jgi:O-antigen ligase/Flp pilus assembly protein TadD
VRRGSAILAALLGAVPLIYATAVPEFDVLRLPFVTTLSIGAAVLVLVSARLGGGFLTPNPRLAAAVAAFFAIQFWGALRAGNPGEGMEQASRDLSALIIFFFIATAPATPLAGPGWAAAAGGTLVALVGIGQAAGVHALPWLTRIDTAYSTLANPNYSGTFMAMCVPLTLALGLQEQGRRRAALFAALALQLLYAGLSGSRAAWVGLAVALALIAIVVARRIGLRRRALAAAVAALVAVLGGFLWASAKPERARSLVDPSYWTNRVRLSMWERTLQAVAERPVVGLGIANFKRWYAERRPEEEVRLHTRGGDPRHMPDMENCHNGQLQLLVETGAIGAIAWIAVLFCLFRFRRRGAPWLHVGAAGALAGFLGSDFFNTLNTQSAHWTLFWICAAILVRPEERSAPIRPWAIAATIAAALAQSFLLSMQVRTILSFSLLVSASEARSDPPLAVERLERAAMFDPYRPAPRVQLGSAYLQLRNPARAREHLLRAIELGPHMLLSRVVLAWSELASGNEEEGRRILSRLAEAAPGWAYPHYELGRVEIQRKSYAAASDHFDRALSFRPDYGLAHAMKGVALARLGEFDRAAESLRRAGEGKRRVELGPLLDRELPEFRNHPALAPFYGR